MSTTTLRPVPPPDDIIRKLQRVSQAAIRNTQERDQLIAAAYQQGVSMREISRAVGMTHPGVRSILIRDGIYHQDDDTPG